MLSNRTVPADTFDVVALGELLIDFAPLGADAAGYPTLAAQPGGAPANFLAALSRFGAKTALISRVGNDAFGRLLRGTVEAAGIDVSSVTMDDEAFTTLAFVTLDENGERSFSFARKPGADTRLRCRAEERRLIDRCRVFHFGSLSLTDEPARSATRRAVDYARTHMKCISYDPNLRRPLWRSLREAKEQIEWGLGQADIVKLSAEEADFLWGLDPERAAAMLLSDYPAELAFVTCGAKGCYYRSRNAAGYCPALSGLQVTDTTGAGDIFGGAALSRILSLGKAPADLSEAELRDITRFASAAAGLSVTRSGGLPSIPDPEAVWALLHV